MGRRKERGLFWWAAKAFARNPFPYIEDGWKRAQVCRRRAVADRRRAKWGRRIEKEGFFFPNCRHSNGTTKLVVVSFVDGAVLEGWGDSDFDSFLFKFFWGRRFRAWKIPICRRCKKKWPNWTRENKRKWMPERRWPSVWKRPASGPDSPPSVSHFRPWVFAIAADR